MAGAASPSSVDLHEQFARIERMNAETRTFVEEGLTRSAEARKLTRDATIAPCNLAITGCAAGAAMVGAVAASLKFLGP